MSPWVRAASLLAVLLVAVVVRGGGPRALAGGHAFTYAEPTSQSRARGFTYEGVAPLDQQVIEAAVAGASPDARRLIAEVGGLVAIRVGSAGERSAGTTQPVDGGYAMVLDLGLVSRGLGVRGVQRLVLHELGHVVDFALVDDATLQALDAAVPVGSGCDLGRTGACTPPEERFAETFAKWAMGDIGLNLDLGYEVPPPSMSLEEWGAPLSRMARRLGPGDQR